MDIYELDDDSNLVAIAQDVSVEELALVIDQMMTISVSTRVIRHQTAYLRVGDLRQ